MNGPDWRRLGHLTPDIPECQQDLWALMAWIQRRLGDALDEVAQRTAEPSWAGAFGDGRDRSLALAVELADEAGDAAIARVADDEQLGSFDAAVGEVIGSAHLPSIIAMGHVTLGELGAVPARLLVDVAGPHGRLLAGRAAEHDTHRPFARVLEITHPTDRDRDNLRRMLRHLNGELFGVYQSWRQTFHTLGIDGEWVDERSAAAVRAALEDLALKVTRTDLRMFGQG